MAPLRKSKKNLVWIDLEMTGLDPERDAIIEIATVVTDEHLNRMAEGPDLVVHQLDGLLRKMNAWNRRQHRKSGLSEEVERSNVSLREAEERTLRFIKQYCVSGFSPICGNSVWQDRRFLIRWMPKLNAYFHYRNVDVSSIKVLIALWYPRRPKLPQKKDSHRALPDIYESIEELRSYRDFYFKKKPGVI